MMRVPALLIWAGSVVAIPATAQDQSDGSEEQSGAPVVIDILAPPPESEAPSAADLKACEEERDAARLSQEIIVCGALNRDADQWFSGGREGSSSG